MVSHFYQADKEYGSRLANAIGIDLKTLQELVSH
jgi:catalase